MGTTDSKMEMAAKEGDAALMRALLKSGQGSVEETNADGWTMLHVCASMGHVDCVKVLLQHGASVAACDRQYYTPIHRAAQHFHVDCLQELLKKAASMSVLQRRKAINATNHFGATPLHWAAVWDSVDCMRLLIEAGANVHAKQHNNQTALHSAAKAGSVEAVAVLIKAGAHTSVKDDSGLTPAQATDTKAVRELLELPAERLEEVCTMISRRPILQPESRAVQCPSCEAKFSLTKRRHPCRKCGKIFCADCCGNVVDLSQMMYYDSPVRVCNGCFSQLKRVDPPEEPCEQTKEEEALA